MTMSQEKRPYRCTHLLACPSFASCKELEKRQIEDIRQRNEQWRRSCWGNLPEWQRMRAVQEDLRHVLDVEPQQVQALRDALGEERFRVLLNAYERAGGFVVEVPPMPPVALP